MRISTNLRNCAQNLGMKLWVSKKDGLEVVNLYDMRDDRLICNWNKYGDGSLVPAINKKLSAEFGFHVCLVRNQEIMQGVLSAIAHDIGVKVAFYGKAPS